MADVVVVGGGLTGSAIAHACAVAGLDAVVLERDRVGQASSGRSAGLLTPDPGPSFRDVAAAHGVRAARRVFETWRRGALDGAALLRRLNIKCALEPQQTTTIAWGDEEKRLRREMDTRKEAGLESSWLSGKALTAAMRLDAAGAARIKDGFTLDPYRATLGLAAAATRKGAVFFEQSPVTRVRFFARHVEATTARGIVRAGHVVVATGSAGAEFKPLRRHFTHREHYLVMTGRVPAAMRKQLGDAGSIVRDVRVPSHAIRWAPDDRLIVGGADQDETPERLRQAVQVQRTGQLMYELLTMYPAISGLQPEYGWEASYGETADGLMYIGPHRNYPRHLFALGGGNASVTGAFVAARILVRALQDAPDKADAVFGWTR